MNKTKGKMFSGLPELGISNGEDLKETLTNCTEPLKAIDQFQVSPGSLYPFLSPLGSNSTRFFIFQTNCDSFGLKSRSDIKLS